MILDAIEFTALYFFSNIYSMPIRQDYDSFSLNVKLMESKFCPNLMK